MDIATKLTDLTTDLRTCRNNIIAKGVDISPTAGFEEVAEKILEIQSTASTGTVTDDSMSMLKQVPLNSISHCYVKSIGGMTYKCNQLIPFPYYSKSNTTNGITATVSDDGSITFNGTAETQVAFIVCASAANVILQAEKYYTFSGNCITNNWPDGLYYNMSVQGKYTSLTKNIQSAQLDLGSRLTDARIIIPAGVVCNNVVFKPMLNIGSTALPYEPFFEGLRDNKVTAIKSYGAQLIPFPYYDNKGVGYTYTTNGVTFTINEDRSITIDTNGGASNGASFVLANYLDLPSGSYTITAYCVGGTWTGNNNNSPYVSGTGLNGSTYLISTRPTATISTKPIWYSINVPSGAVVDNVTLKIMLNKGSVAVPYQDYHEPATYFIPESLQGTGKGVQGASDTIDFETNRETARVKTIALGDVGDYSIGNRGDSSSHPYISNDGIVALTSYSVNDFNVSLKMNSLCSHLSMHNNWQGNIIGVTFQVINSTGSKYMSVCIKASDAGISTDDSYRVIIDKGIAWLKGNNVILTYAIAEPTETDIDTFAFDPLIKVEGGGSLEIITDNGGAVPTSIIYQTIV